MKRAVKLFLVALLLFTASPSPAQTGSVRVFGGGVQFLFTAYNQYSTGVTLTNKNTVKISYSFTAPSLNWQLRVKSDYPAIMSDNVGGNDITDLTYLKIVTGSITPEVVPAGSTTVNIDPNFHISSTPQVLASGTATGSFEVTLNLSYSFGTPPPSLINIPWGLYYTNLTFILEYF